MDSGQELFNRFRMAASRDYTREQVIDAALAMVLNAVSQSHDRLPEAEEHADHLATAMKTALKRDFYGPEGLRKGRFIVDPGVTKWLLSEGALRPQDFGLEGSRT